MSKQEWKLERIASPTGADLCLDTLPAKGDLRAVIQINHGMAEYGARYLRFARALASAGYLVCVHDHRGHGETRAEDAPRGVFGTPGGFDKVIADVDHMNGHLRHQHPGVPIVCFGHSMGAIIAIIYAMRHGEQINGLAAWNSGLDAGNLLAVLRLLLRCEALIRGRNTASALANKVTFETWNKNFAPNRTEFDWLSRDQAEVDKYVADPDCGYPCSSGLWLDLTAAIVWAANQNRFDQLPSDLPVHLLAGEADPCSDQGKGVARIARRMQKANMSDVTLSLLPKTRHESLNEINREAVTAAFIDWLDQRFG